MPADYPEDIPVSWDEQVQKAVDCYNAGATMLHIHVRDPKASDPKPLGLNTPFRSFLHSIPQ